MKQAKISRNYNIPRPYTKSNWSKHLKCVNENIPNVVKPKNVSINICVSYSLIFIFFKYYQKCLHYLIF